MGKRNTLYRLIPDKHSEIEINTLLEREDGAIIFDYENLCLFVWIAGQKYEFNLTFVNSTQTFGNTFDLTFF